MSDTTMNYDYPDTGFEKVWAILQEVAQRQTEMQKEADQRQTEMQKEADQRQKEADQRQREDDQRRKEADQRRKEADQKMQEIRLQMQETDRIIKETAETQKEITKQMKISDRKIGELSNRFGELAEHLVVPNIKEKFNALGFTFVQASQNIEITDLEGNCLAEIDILLENGSIVMVLEVKSKPSHDDVAAHIKHMEIMRRAADKRNDTRVFQGAIAGAIMTKEVRNHIIKNGFYAIEQTGDTVTITIPEGFKARQW